MTLTNVPNEPPLWSELVDRARRGMHEPSSGEAGRVRLDIARVILGWHTHRDEIVEYLMGEIMALAARVETLEREIATRLASTAARGQDSERGHGAQR